MVPGFYGKNKMGIFFTVLAICGSIVITAMTVAVTAGVAMMIREMWRESNDRMP